MSTTFIVTPFGGLSVWEVLKATLRHCANDGRQLLAVYRVTGECFAVVVEEGA